MTRSSSALLVTLLVGVASPAAAKRPTVPVAQTPEWLRNEVKEVERQQAVHTLAGFTGGRGAGGRPAASVLPADVQGLWSKLQRSRARLNADPLNAHGTIEVVGAGRGALPSLRGTKITKFASTSTIALLTSPDDRAPTEDAQSTDPTIVARAQALGNDPVRIYEFVHDTIQTEIYSGSKKGALGTLREGAGNDYDQASLLIALLRAAGFDARYQISAIALTDGQAATLTSTNSVEPAATLLATAGVPVTFSQAGGVGLKVEHAFVRAYVPVTAYRGVGRPGSSFGWVNLAPAFKNARTAAPVDLRDAVAFDFDGYLATLTSTRPSDAYFGQLRSFIQTSGVACDTLESAQPIVQLVAQHAGIFPAELPAPKVQRALLDEEWRGLEMEAAALPAARRHTVTFRAATSQGVAQLSYTASMPALWGKSVTVVYEPLTPTDAATIASYGGIEQTPAYLVRLKAVLKIDGTAVASGVGENPGLVQTLTMSTTSPGTGAQSVDHALSVGGVYAFVLDPGLVPTDLIGERQKRLPGLLGDDQAAEKLHISGLTYFHELGTARQQIAGLHWHRIFKDVEETMVALDLRINAYRGTPVSIARQLFMLDAALIRSGNVSVDGDDRRRVQLARLVGFESSFLEHRAGELFYGPRQFSAVKLLQLAHQAGTTVRSFTANTVDDALEQIQWPAEFEERLRDAADRGLTVQAPVVGHSEAGLGTLFGFVATDPVLGAGEYIVAFEAAAGTGVANGGVGDAGPTDDASPPTGCLVCQGNAAAGSQVHLLSGNYVHQETDLTLPARGLPLVFTRTYSAQLGWHHNYDQHLVPAAAGGLTYIDETGVPRAFTRDPSGVWLPPPTFFETIEPDGTGYKMVFKDGVVYRFGGNGKLLSQSDLNGHQVTLTYRADGLLQSVTGGGGATLTLGYDGVGRLETVSDSASRRVTFGHDTAGNLTDETNVLGKTRHYGYDSGGHMVTKTDFRGNTTRIFYDDLVRAVRTEDPEGGVRTFAYDSRHTRVVATDRDGNPQLYELNANAQPVRIVDPIGNETTMTYDDRGNKLIEQDARGNATVSSYDGQGNVLTRRDPIGVVTTYTYGAFSRLETMTDPAGTTHNVYDPATGNLQTATDANSQVTSYVYVDGLPVQIIRPGTAITAMHYDPAGNVDSITDPESGTTTLHYDPAGHLDQMADPNLHSRVMTVDAKGQVKTILDPLLHETMLEYDDDGNRTKVIDPALRATTMSYDRLGRLLVTTDALGNVSKQEYDREGRVLARIDGRGFRTEMRYDAAGRLVSTRDPLGHETTMGYCADLSQQPCLVVDPLGNATKVTEDELGREVERQDPLGHIVRTVYDTTGRRDHVVDPAGLTTRFGYDPGGRLLSVTDALLGVTRYGYDGRGNRQTVTDANQHTTHFTYDRANRLTEEQTPIGTFTDFGYDPAGNRSSKLDGKRQSTTFIYDANRRLTDIHYAGGTTAHFEYDALGNRTLEQNVDSRRTMTYDALNRLETVLDTETGRTTRYEYDAAGNRIAMTVTPDNETTRYAWDARGLLASLTDPEGGEYHFSYDAAGRRTKTTYPNSMVLTSTYDAASRVVSMVYRKASGDVIESFTYTYDSRGNRSSKIFADGTAETYGYDDLSRLVKAAYPSGRVVQYTYDAVGNRTEMVEGTSTAAATTTCPGDRDCDGVPDASDNCPTVRNPAQTDSDAPATPAGLVAGYNLNEATTGGVAIHDVTGRSDGIASTTVGSPGHVAGKYGNGLEVLVPVVYQYVKVPTSPSLEQLGSELTLAAWIKVPTTSTGGAILSKHLVFQFVVVPQGGAAQLQLTITNPRAFNGAVLTASPTGVVPLGQWTHVAATAKAGHVKFYVNGALVSDVTAPLPDSFNQSGSLFLMCNNHVGTECSSFQYVGALDEVGIWSRALSQAEIQTAMNTPLSTQDRQGDACDPCPSNPERTCAPTTCLDADGDGYGPQGASACGAGKVTAFDCNDSDPRVHPGAVEVCDGVDNNCDGQIDEGCLQTPLRTVYTYNEFNQLLVSGPAVTCAAGDRDCDGKPDALDNCPAVYNPMVVPAPSRAAAHAVAYYKLDGTVTDSIGGFNGTPNSQFDPPSRYTAARAVVDGKALVVDSTGGGFLIPSTMAATLPANRVSVEAWVFLNAATTVQRPIVEVGSSFATGVTGFALHVDTSGHLAGGFWSSAQGFVLTSDPTVLPVGRWVHVAATFDGRLHLYRGGTRVVDGPVVSFPAFTGQSMVGQSAGTGFRWNGAIDDVAVYGYALGDAEILSHAREQDATDAACDLCPTNPDPNCVPTTCIDADGDGYGAQGSTACPGGVTKIDCDDHNAAVHPGAAEVADGVDNDCDGVVDGKIAASGAVRNSWDANGNQTRKVGAGGDTEYVFDVRDRLVEVKQGGSSVAKYGYDTQNLRVYIDDARGERRVLLDGVEEMGEYEVGALGRVARYEHDLSQLDALLAQVAGSRGHAVTDALGSVYEMTDESASAQGRYSYDAYGATAAPQQTVSTVWGFTGRRQDVDSRLYYRARYYDPGTGRFSSRDPLAEGLTMSDPGGFLPRAQYAEILNGYGYGGSSPAVNRDPTGKVFGMLAGFLGVETPELYRVLLETTLLPDLTDLYSLIYVNVYMRGDPCRDAVLAERTALDLSTGYYGEEHNNLIRRRFPEYLYYWSNGESDIGHAIAIEGLQTAILSLATTMVVKSKLPTYKVWSGWYYFLSSIPIPSPQTMRSPGREGGPALPPRLPPTRLGGSEW